MHCFASDSSHRFFNPFLTKRKKKLDLKNERAESLQKKLYNVNKKANRLTDTVSRLEKELSQAYTNFDVVVLCSLIVI